MWIRSFLVALGLGPLWTRTAVFGLLSFLIVWYSKPSFAYCDSETDGKPIARPWTPTSDKSQNDCKPTWLPVWLTPLVGFIVAWLV